MNTNKRQTRKRTRVPNRNFLSPTLDFINTTSVSIPLGVSYTAGGGVGKGGRERRGEWGGVGRGRVGGDGRRGQVDQGKANIGLRGRGEGRGEV